MSCRDVEMCLSTSLSDWMSVFFIVAQGWNRTTVPFVCDVYSSHHDRAALFLDEVVVADCATNHGHIELLQCFAACTLLNTDELDRQLVADVRSRLGEFRC